MKYDVAIIGGGLAGLALSIDLRKRGYSIVVIEKGGYPRHKVCGEYISMESHEYLHSICPGLASFQLPRIRNFKLSSTGKHGLETPLDPGGFGISRYLLEEILYTEAKKHGVLFMLKCKAVDTQYTEEERAYTVITTTGDIKASIVCHSTGRKSNFETKEKRTSLHHTNYIGIKYHVRLQRDPGFVEIHNFPGGYCGVSGIEDNKTCLCYIVNSKKLNSVHNSIKELEKVYLHQNDRLKKIFREAEFLFRDPLTISGIDFNIRKPAADGSFYIGDAAGSIAPVTGNGMSMALRSAAVLASMIDICFSRGMTRQQLTDKYTAFWNKEFATRVKLSRHFQKLSEYPLLTRLSIGLLNPLPSLAKSLISYTHGVSF